MEEYDIIIVGGGPTGLLLASELALWDIKVLVLEQNAIIDDQPKAGTYHARTVQSLMRRGILRVPCMYRISHDYRDRLSEPFQFAGFPWITLSTSAVEGPVMMGFSQADVERILEYRLSQWDISFQRSTKVMDIQESASGVKVIAEQEGVTHSYHAQYVIGCDGARSIVRMKGDFTCTEYAPTMRAMLAMAELPLPTQLSPGWHMTPRGWILLNLNKFGQSRIITFLFDGPEYNRKLPIELEEFSEAIEYIAGKQVDITSITKTSRFSDYSRIADNYRAGRLFLVGDAAHVHFPLGGQGLNLGLQDAMNLGWKLAMVIRGQAHETLLDTYSQERQPYGQKVIDNTRVQSLLMNSAIIYDPLRNFMHDMLQHSPAHDWVADMINGESVNYTGHLSSASTMTMVGKTIIGKFFPNITLYTSEGETSIAELLETGDFILLCQGEIVSVEHIFSHFTAKLKTIIVLNSPEEFQSNILIRPDGYILWQGDNSELYSEKFPEYLFQIGFLSQKKLEMDKIDC